jgi:hypothetical protein
MLQTDSQKVERGVSDKSSSNPACGDIARGGPRMPSVGLIPYTDSGEADEAARSGLTADHVQSAVVGRHGVVGHSQLSASEGRGQIPA